MEFISAANFNMYVYSALEQMMQHHYCDKDCQITQEQGGYGHAIPCLKEENKDCQITQEQGGYGHAIPCLKEEKISFQETIYSFTTDLWLMS